MTHVLVGCLLVCGIMTGCGPTPRASALNPNHTQTRDPALVARAATFAMRELAEPTPHMHGIAQGRIPQVWNESAYLADPARYLNDADPTRAGQPAQPAATVAMLEPVGPTAVDVLSLGSVECAVRTDPGMPVTFASDGLGSFASGLTSITVASDAEGIARVRFTATAGTIAVCPIRAASPVRGGIVRFIAVVTSEPSSTPPAPPLTPTSFVPDRMRVFQGIRS